MRPVPAPFTGRQEIDLDVVREIMSHFTFDDWEEAQELILFTLQEINEHFGWVSPEAAEGGLIGLVRDGDRIEIDIPGRRIHLAVDEAELAERRAAQDAAGWKPAAPRKRKVTTALRAYAAFATSADKGAVRVVPEE